MNRSPLRRLAALAVLGAVFARELAMSCVAVALAAFARRPVTRSAILAVPIDLRTDAGVVALANLVTLTPGTCSLHVSDDRRTLFVHALDVERPDEVVAGIKSAFEARIRRIEA